jgi:hypothetical protein
MRLPLIPPAELTPQQKSLYDEMRRGIASNFNAFKVVLCSQGAFRKNCAFVFRKVSRRPSVLSYKMARCISMN